MTNLKTCPKSYCKAPIIHWHDDGAIIACLAVVNGEPCPHEDARIPCYAPRVQPQPERPLNLPDVDTVARVIHESDGYPTTNWANRSEDAKNDYLANARAVLDLIVACQPVWERAERGTRIEKGQRYRIEYANGDAYELTAFGTRSVQDDGTTVYVLHTVPEPEDPRVEVLAEEMEAEYPHCDDEWPCAGAERFRGAARRAIARLDAMGGEGR